MTQINLSLTATEAKLIMLALGAISPTGGNSPTRQLFHRIADQTGIEVTNEEIYAQQLVATQEALGDDLYAELDEEGKIFHP